MKNCSNCNVKLNRKNKFCPECGMPVEFEINDKSDALTKSRFIIIALSILLMLTVIALVFILFSNDAKKPDEKENNIDEGVSTTTLVTDSITSFSEDPDRITKAAESVVKLNCYNRNDELIGVGSGFAAFEKGVIVTNYHVIADYPDRIEIETETGQKCDIFGGIGVSKERDIAILYYQHRSAGIDLPVLTTGSSDNLKKGEKVIAIGSPMGLKNVVSSGIFSSYTSIDKATNIQFTASISSGSSGGALFNDNGDVIGITYASLESGQNLNFAVPIEFVKSLWKSESSDKSELMTFYDSILPHYTIDYVLSNYAELQDTVFYLNFKSFRYEFLPNGLEIYCTDDGNKTLKAFYYRNDRFVQTMVKLISGKTGIRCRGTEWSDSDNRPYVIIDW